MFQFAITSSSTTALKQQRLPKGLEMAWAANSPVFGQSAKGFETVR